MLSKNDLRVNLHEMRRNIVDKHKKDKLIEENLFMQLEKFKSVFCYVSMGMEVNTHNIIEKLFELGKKVFVPFTTNGVMKPMLCTTCTNLKTDNFGNIDRKYLVDSISDIDLAIVPCLGFNNKLYRIGYGGGYYDRYLKDFFGYKIGLGYSEQAVEFEEDIYDIPMDLIITEKRR